MMIIHAWAARDMLQQFPKEDFILYSSMYLDWELNIMYLSFH